jgi:hypothetical protein
MPKSSAIVGCRKIRFLGGLLNGIDANSNMPGRAPQAHTIGRVLP